MDIKKALAEHRASGEPHGGGIGPFIHDIVYGANDGIITTFAVVASVTGGTLAPVTVLVLGPRGTTLKALTEFSQPELIRYLGKHYVA